MFVSKNKFEEEANYFLAILRSPRQNVLFLKNDSRQTEVSEDTTFNHKDLEIAVNIERMFNLFISGGLEKSRFVA